jgi:DNA-binding MarR family transcriptional regulator
VSRLGTVDEVRWLDPAEQRAWRAYLDATRLLIRVLDQQLESDAGISFTDYELLVQLSEGPGRRLRMRELADAALATRSGVTRAVTRLERAGWVRRVECLEDRRGMYAELTPSGLGKLAASAPGHVAAVRSHVIGELTAAQFQQLGATCTHLAGRLRADR